MFWRKDQTKYSALDDEDDQEKASTRWVCSFTSLMDNISYRIAGHKLQDDLCARTH